MKFKKGDHVTILSKSVGIRLDVCRGAEAREGWILKLPEHENGIVYYIVAYKQNKNTGDHYLESDLELAYIPLDEELFEI
jgi:hypothetical protein